MQRGCKTICKLQNALCKGFSHFLAVLLYLMRHPDRIFFEKLKEEIARTYCSANSGVPEKIEEWSGKTIEGFQNDLQQKVKSAISLRWFYTHIKSVNEDRLPRTDVLDLLCQYAGYNNWVEFVAKKKEEGIVREEIKEIPKTIEKQPEQVKSGKKRGMMPLSVFLLLVIGLMVIWAMGRKGDEITCRFCFTDADVGTSVTKDKINITLLHDQESPQIFTGNDSGCVSIHCKPGKVTFIVHAEYYKPDTIIRTITEGFQPETIQLKPDDYAMMISIFSRSKVDDWTRRRDQLQAMFTDDARIFQVYPGDKRGMEMLNKDEFIDKLTMPIASLKNIEVIETIYNNGKIAALRFIQKEDNK